MKRKAIQTRRMYRFEKKTVWNNRSCMFIFSVQTTTFVIYYFFFEREREQCRYGMLWSCLFKMKHSFNYKLSENCFVLFSVLSFVFCITLYSGRCFANITTKVFPIEQIVTSICSGESDILLRFFTSVVFTFIMCI